MRWLSIIALTIIFLSQVDAGPHSSTGTKKSSEVVHYFAKKALQGFSIKVWISNQMTMGLQAWDPNDHPGPIETYGLEYPVGSGIDHLYGAGPWIGGVINGRRYVSEGYNGNTASKYFVPNLYDVFYHTSTLNTDEPNKRFYDDDADGRIDEDDLDGSDNDGDWNSLTDDVGIDGIPDSLEVGCKGAYNALTNSDPAFDNYDPIRFNECAANRPRKNIPAVYTERNNRSDHGEPHVDEDYAAISESDYYCSANDSFSQGGHYPMGIKVIQKSYAWESPYGEAILPFDYYFINVGSNVIRDVVIGFFADMDVGPVSSGTPASRNYACYIDSIRTGYIHNPIDRGSTPLGITVLGTPLPLDQLRYVFQWFDFSTPQIPNDSDATLYGWMSGAAVAPFFIKECQPPTSPSDTRFLFSFGQDPLVTENSKFKEFYPGDTLKVSIAFVSGLGVSATPNNMIENAFKAMNLYKNNYTIPVRPQSPKLTVRYEEGKMHLAWSNDPLDVWDPLADFRRVLPPDHWRLKDSPTGDSIGGRTFEGFRVWRRQYSDLDTSDFTLYAQYDVDDEIKAGFQTGLQFTFVDSLIRRGYQYEYAVTSYGITPPAVREYPLPDGGSWYDTLQTIVADESKISANATKIWAAFGPSKTLGEVLVVPNPYYGNVYYTDGNGYEGLERDWTPDKRIIRFINLPEKATIRIFSLAGDLITTLHHDDALHISSGLPTGQEDWHLFSESGRPIASGLFIFSVESNLGTQIGKFVIIM